MLARKTTRGRGTWWEDEGSLHSHSFSKLQYLKFAARTKKQQVQSLDLNPLQSHSLQRVQAAFDSKSRHVYLQFLQKTNKIQTRYFSAFSLLSPESRKQAEPLRPTLPPPQTGAIGSTKPWNKTDHLWASDGIETPWSQAALYLSYKKILFIPKAVCCLCSYTGAGHSVFHSCHRGSCLSPSPAAFLRLHISTSTQVKCFRSLSTKGKTNASTGKEVPRSFTSGRSCGFY